MRARFLADMANKHGWAKGAEIGLWYGKTFFHLLDAGLSMVGVDIWIPGHQYHNDVMANRARILCRAYEYGDRARIIELPSIEAAELVENGSLDFVFIDGDHSLPGVCADIQSWSPKVREGGFVTGHDWDIPSVREAVKICLPDAIPGDETNDFVWIWEKP